MFLTILLAPLFAAIVYLIPPKYESTAKLLVRLGRGAVSIDPTANLSQTVSLQESRLAQVNSVKELLASRELAERVVDQVGAERILASYSPFEKALENVSEKARNSRLGKYIPVEPVVAQGDYSATEIEKHVQLEKACMKLMESMYVGSPKDAYTISVEVKSGDPFLSRDLVAAFVDQYKKFHVESYQSTGSLGFFEEQAEKAQRHAADSQAALRDAKTERGIVELSNAKLALSTSISNIKQQIISTDGEVAAAKSELESLQSQIAVMPANLQTEVTLGIQKVTGNAMRQILYDLEVAYEQFAVKFTEDNPKLVALREQLEAAREIAKSEEGEQRQAKETINPIRQQLELASKTTIAKLAGSESKREILTTQLEELTNNLATLNQDEVELNQLTWEATLAETDYLQTAAARSRARQINALDEQNLSEISIVQPATLTLKKVSPQRLVLLVLSTALAMALAGGQALLRGLFNSPAPSPNESAEAVNVPASRDRGWKDELPRESLSPTLRPNPIEQSELVSATH